MSNLVKLLIFSIIFFSCKVGVKKVRIISIDNISDSIFLPKYSVTNMDYELDYKIENNLKRKLSGIRLNLKSFTEANLNDELDIHGTPDYSYENLYVYAFPDNRKREIYFNAKKVKKEYTFYYEKDKLICVLEGVYDDVFIGDSLFFNENRIFLWKNTYDKYVKDSISIKGKTEYIMRLDREIKEIIDLGFTQYIEDYEYKKDSISSFVIGNLK